MKILVLHGPNLNLFGRREPHIYGTMTFAEINKRIKQTAAELKAQVVILQSNHEGDLIDALHKHMDSAQGAVINPGGLTQYGVALHDAIKAMPFPCIEVHMSNIQKREEWRHKSIISSATMGTIAGFGWRSYTAALRVAIMMAREPAPKKKSK